MAPRVPRVSEARLPNVGFRPMDFGAREAGQALEQSGDNALRIAQQARARGDAAVVVGAEAQLAEEMNRALYDPEKGALNKLGEEALQGEEDALKRLGEAEQRVVKSLANDTQRAIFSARAGAMARSAKGQLTRHIAGQQRVVEEANSRARAAAALDTATQAVLRDDAEASEAALIGAEGGIRALAPSAEAGERAVREFRQKADVVALEALLTAEKHDKAVAYFAQAKERLGVHAQRFEKEIQAVGRKAAARTNAADILKQSRGKDDFGFVDKATALALFDKLPEGPEKEETQRLLAQDLVLSEARQNEVIDGWWKKALGQYNGGGLGAVDAVLRQRLRQYAPEKEAQLIERAEQKVRQARTSGAEARREARERNELARNEFLALPVEDQRTLDIDAHFGARVDPGEIANLKRLQRRVLDADQVSLERFRTQARSTVGKMPKKEADAFVAELSAQYLDHIGALKKPPTQDEALQIITSAHLQVLRERALLPDTNEPAWKKAARERQEAAKERGDAPTAPAKPPKAQRILELRKQGLSNAQIKTTMDAEGY